MRVVSSEDGDVLSVDGRKAAGDLACACEVPPFVTASTSWGLCGDDIITVNCYWFHSAYRNQKRRDPHLRSRRLNRGPEVWPGIEGAVEKGEVFQILVRNLITFG